MQPSEFLPKDRDGALLMIRAELYARLAEVQDLLVKGQKFLAEIDDDDDSDDDESDYNDLEYAQGFNERLISEQTFIRNLLDIIERS